MNKKVYGFKIGKHIVEVKSINEQKATMLLIKNFWDLIDKNEFIELLGEVK